MVYHSVDNGTPLLANRLIITDIMINLFCYKGSRCFLEGQLRLGIEQHLFAILNVNSSALQLRFIVIATALKVIDERRRTTGSMSYSLNAGHVSAGRQGKEVAGVDV